MKQLGVIDAAFVNLEHPNTPQHIGGLGIYDQSTAPGGSVRFKGVIASFEKRLLKQPIFRSRLVRTPGNFDRPYWVQDANFDVEFHIRHIALPQPGDWRQLCILVSRLHARPLDMARPLWEAYIIEGLDNIVGVPKGAFAIYTKMHHSLVDGAGGASFMSAIHDLEPDPKPQEGQTTIMVDSAPSPVYLATNTAINQVRNSVKMAKGAVGLARDIGKLAVGMARKQIPMPPINSPKTRFNKPVGPYRVFDAAEFALDDIKQIKNAVNGKINDVVLAIISGALRRYLDSLGELPEESLAVSIPLNMRTRRGENDDNNQIGSVFLDLHTNIKDPIKRLNAIMQSAQEAKTYGEVSPLVDVMKVCGMFSPVITRPVINTYINNQLTRHMPANISGVVSNVAGPPFPLYSAGAKMVRYYGLGLLTPGMGIFNLAFSANGLMTLSVLADRDTMPDPAVFRDFMYETFEELRESAGKMQAQEEKKAATTVKASKVAGAEKPGIAAAGKAKPAARKKTANGKARAASNGRKKVAGNGASAKTNSASARTKSPARPKKARPPAKAPVQKAKTTGGKPTEPSKSVFDAGMDNDKVVNIQRSDTVVH